MSLEITVQQREPGVYLVAPVGEINTETAPDFEKKLKELLPQAKAFVFDLQDMAYISSMGLSAFFRIKQLIEEKGGTILLVHVSAQVQKVFDVVKVFSESMMASLEQADDHLDSFLDDVQKGKIEPKRPGA
jgi:anti-anti-sigma factor